MTSTSALHNLRCHIWDYPDSLQPKARRVLDYLKRRVMRQREAPAKGMYSDLTKRELRMTGTCETDWY